MGKGKVLRVYDTKAVLENLDNGHCLLISQAKDSGARNVEEFERAHPPDLGTTSQVMPFEAVFGFYDLLGGSYAALMIESEPYVSAGQIDIRRSKKIVVVPLFKSTRTLSDSKQQDEDRYLQLLHLAFAEHQFFFSFTYDVTLTQQTLAKNQQQRFATHDALWVRADHRFFWNREIVLDLITASADEWIVPFMSAYVEIRTDCNVEDVKFTLLFISRRSRYRQGCRFTKRGLDANGNAANFVETEQILVYNDGRISAHVQTRGSIPLKWSSPVHMRYAPEVFIDDNRATSSEWAEKHVRQLVDQYSNMSGASNILCINLVDNKKEQGRLGSAFKDAMDSIQPKMLPSPLSYMWFDFHHECKQKGKWKNLAKLVTQADSIFRAQGYFSQAANGEITSWQIGTIRTNCMDNLDRTNVVQSLFARRSLILQVGKESQVDINGKGLLETPWKNFEKMFKHVWANNANAMSQLYAGTGALKVDFTRTGKRTITGMFNDGVNSCMRYYINNLTDGVKQDSIDLLLGNYRPDTMQPSPFTTRSSQDALSSNITKAFVLMMLIFSTFLLLIPPVLPLVSHVATSGINNPYLAAEMSITHLKTHFLLSLGITLLIVMYYMYKIMKKGSTLGNKMVIHPELCPEPLPPGR
mmetsp:Transcript_8036/g.13364  ORF Transcript_8036/g.13364 Transcript_8036/m.13364 type:complete len:640 (-) Transcript_8036:1088-3007(-)|eukprot:CAMPEP_0175013248 /NCGR_PEP_ID=MMETSP0005-20121125/9803_1 /TAXON_ID=420556 /ORGANISM="Ochromonas sp., Strain CCMP1393" /LENGTH=639 /DNA_ID=CAMNT_0016269663 /DNA_START=42 /DNA_END=1961 /DNA_ORIENTATION=-